MSCGVIRRCGSDLALLWLWCRPAVTAPIRSLVWEPPFAMRVGLKRQKNPKTKNQKTVASPLAIREKRQNGVAMGQTSKVILAHTMGIILDKSLYC